MIEPIKETITIYQGSEWGRAGGMIAESLDGSETLFDTSDFTAKFTIRQGDFDGAIVFDADENDYITVGYDPAPAERSTAYGLGQRVTPDDGLNGLIYECSTAGTTDSSAPTWPVVLGDSVADGTAEWTALASDASVANIRIAIPSSITGALTDWGLGFYTIDVTDEWGNTQRLFHGAAYLSRRTTY